MRKWVLFVVSSAVACGGSVDIGTQDGGIQDGAADAKHDAKSDGGLSLGGDAGTSDAHVVTTPCAASPPAPGAPCTQLGEECEYGTSFYASCDDVYLCDPSSQQWTLEPQDPNLCSGTSQGCPAQLGDAAGVCSTPGTECQYAEGFCQCHGYCGGPPPPGPTSPSWSCVVATQSCPAVRPRLGTACAQEGQQCGYMICCAGTQMTCGNGVWQGNTTLGPCP